MIGTRISTLVIILLMLSTTAFGEDVSVSPDEVMKKVDVAYRSLETYRVEGKITTDIGSGGTQHKLVTSFAVFLKKPNLYLISWSRKNMLTLGMGQSGAVWSDGTQPCTLFTCLRQARYRLTKPRVRLNGKGVS